MTPDEERFLAVLLDAIKQCEAFDYYPNRFKPMLYKHGPFGAVRQLLDDPVVAPGFGTLAEHGKLGLSAEAFALRPEWQSFFTPKQRATARRRLEGTPFALSDLV